ncbi:hypothetical protein L6452_05537 [Arctium lappa]|uniref:Uncharacterized protein n=1 Tax=Arctium lappa TaxID=4217 RepID=A0ACB9EHR3_ARCLA|nr:hypothetical protein L6452_05537 [Arctium lappa]
MDMSLHSTFLFNHHPQRFYAAKRKREREILEMVENTTTTSSPPTTSNHDTNAKVFTNSSKTREEGELSASENEEFAGCQFPDSTTLPGAPLNKDNNAVDMGKSALTHNPTSSAVARTSVHLNNRKGLEKNRVPFVISFSDDDSGSDSEEDRKGNTMESNDTTRGVIETRRLSTSLGNSRMTQQTAKTNTRIPKNFSTSRTFVSSMNRVNGTSFKSGGGTFVGPKSQLKKSNAPSKNKVGQNVHINSSKLQDLRQLIAIRENELKSRAGKHDKEAASSSLKNSANVTLKSTAVRSRDSAERILVEPKEPEKKRLKVSEPPTNTLISVGKHDRPPTESTIAAGISALESDGLILKGRYDGSYCDKEVLTGTGQSSAMQQINKVKNHIPSTNLPSGTSIVRNSRRHNRITNLAESSAPLTAKTSPHRQGCLNNSSFWNHFGATNMSKTGDMDIKSLLEIEELQDKELDEAQEHRRKCEIEERNALKAYRKAQRALVEANARCSYLYHKRELFSANLHSHVMEDSSMFWSNMPLEHTGAHVNTITNMSENNMHLVPISRHQLQNDFHLRDQHQYDLNVRSTDDLREDGKNLVSESCGEPDTSASEPQEEEKTNDVCSSLHENNTLGEDEQTSAFELKAGDSSLDSQGEGICSERTKEINDDTITLDPTEDSLLLEATLRSQLFARLGIKTSKKNELGQSMEAAVEREDGEIMEGVENIPSPETEKDQLNDFEDVERSEKSISEHPMGIEDQCPAEKFSVNNGSYLAEPILRSAFGYAMFTSEMNSMQSHTKNLQIHTNDIYDEKKVADGVCGATPTDIISNASKYSLLDIYVPEVGSFSNSLAINPFWPLCMFELRGKCNDDDCRWQHLKDYSSRSIDCNNNDTVLGSSLQIRNGATIVSKCLGSLPLAPPTYLVCLDSLKGDSHPYKYLLAQTVEQRWQKYFSASLVVSSSSLGDLHSDEPCLHGPEAHIEIHGVWNRQSSFFHGKNVKEGLPEKHMDETNQPLEIALLTLSREVNKQKGRREALIVIARALEEHPTSALLWIVYLHIYYGNQKSIGKDDLFRHAVDHNKSSYELWLMFINSRDKLDDRLHGYNTALSALCHHASAPDRDPELDSECILDLLLQMMNCLCSCGQVDDAIQKVYRLLPSIKRSSDLHASFLSDVDACLTISDKCILWVSCIYLVMYKKLPDTIVQQLECQKELSAIEWHAVHLRADEKQQAVTLMKLATESLASSIDSKSAENKKTLKAAQLFALNHIRCAAVLQGSDCCNNLLNKYTQLYPLCLDFVLLSIRAKECDSTDATYAAFEVALSNWVGKPGVQCIWNQYAAYALENGRINFAKELMERWYHSIWEVQYPKSETLNISAWMSSSSQTDIIFGLLNLSLHKKLQNEHTEARIAIEQVLEVASSEDYKQCVREHAACLLKSGSILGEEAPSHTFLNMLNRYLMDSRALPPPEPLSRSFIKSIRNPKMQKLVNDLLTPISSDFSLVNLVLESCFGPSLLPSRASDRVTDVVDFAEALMEMRPGNYQLALSICKIHSGVNASVCFWASGLLMDSLFQAVPVAPESVWVEAADMLKKLADFTSMLESFHKRALSVYPYSMRLWKSYVGLYGDNTTDQVMEMARKKGIKV